MINILRSEWVKLRSVRSSVITLGLAAALVVLVAVLTGHQANDRGDAINLTGLTGGVSGAALIFGAMGVQIIGQEYRFNTIRPTFTAVPRRFTVLLAKLLVIMVAVSVVSAVMVAFCYAVGTFYVKDFVVDGVDHRVMWGIVVFSALWAAFGFGVGAIVRQPIAGILILMGDAFVAEPLLANNFHSTIPWIPFNNGFQMTLRVESSDLRSVFAGGVYLAIVATVLVVIGMVLANRRDA